MRTAKSVVFKDFSGGLNTKSQITALEHNEASDLQNINLLPNHRFIKRNGNTEFNSSAMVDATTPISGLAYYRQADMDEYLVAVAGTKLFVSSSLSGTMSDITGSLTITSSQNNIWTSTTMNDTLILVGGAPDAPIKYTGSGNGAILGGSPPSGSFVSSANNRVFIGGTSANPSRIYWSALGNIEDWSGSGSGSQDVDANDGDSIVCAVPNGPDHMYLFKQNSIHDLIIRQSPFPVFNIAKGVGCVSKRGWVVVDGLIYFITPEPRMKAFDGSKIYDFSDKIDNVWDGLNKSRLQYIHGQYYPKLRQIMWFCSNGASNTHNYCIIWDLERKCWLRHTSGYSMNVSEIAQDRLLYCGAYNGKVYKQDVSGTLTDNSDSAAINGYWKTGWYDLGTMIEAKSIPYIAVNFTTQTSGTFDFGYAYDFATQTSNTSISMVGPGSLWGAFLWGTGTWGGATDKTAFVHAKGIGRFVQFFIRNQNDTEVLSFNGFEIPVNLNAPTQ